MWIVRARWGDGHVQVRVECVYEPPQEGFPEGFELKEDPRTDTVEELAGLLGLKRVIYCICCVCVNVCIHYECV